MSEETRSPHGPSGLKSRFLRVVVLAVGAVLLLTDGFAWTCPRDGRSWQARGVYPVAWPCAPALWMAPVAPPVELRLTAFEGTEPFYAELTTITKQDMTVMGMKHVQEQTRTLYLRCTPREKKDGKYVVVQKILGLILDIDIGGNKISYDSTVKAQPRSNLSEFFKALVGPEFTVTIGQGKDGNLVVDRVEGLADLVSKLTAINPALETLLKKVLTEEDIKEMAAPMFDFIPPGGIIPTADPWTTTGVVTSGPTGQRKIRNTYTDAGQVNGRAWIRVATESTHTAPPVLEPGLSFRVLKSDIKSKDGHGIIVFDQDKGRLQSRQMSVRLEGSLTIDIAGTEELVELKSLQTTRFRTMDKNPIEGK
jgi:hypothetical protein